MDKLVFCKYCGSKIAENARCCPNCGAKYKKSHKVLGFILLAIGLICLASGTINWKDNDTRNQSDISSQESTVSNSEDAKIIISLSEFDEIKTGMSYKEVCDIIGGEGTLFSSADIDEGYKMEIYEWTGDRFFGANANVIFENGQVSSKAQTGLK